MGAMFYGFREREQILSIFETITGLRMNNAYIRPGGLAADLPDEALPQIRDMLKLMPKRLKDLEDLLTENYIWKARTQGIGYLDLTGCMALGITGPVLRSTGLPHDLRKSQPYCGYETYDFDVITDDGCDAYGRYLIRVKEMHESLKIIEQCVERLEKTPGPVMIDDKKLAWPADLKLGPDGLGNSPEHIAKIMGHSMEGLIHHFKLVTEGIRVPAGPGLRRGRVAAWRTRRAHGLRRRHTALSRALPRPLVHQPAGRCRHVRGRHGRRRDLRRRLDRSGDGRRGPMSVPTGRQCVHRARSAARRGGPADRRTNRHTRPTSPRGWRPTPQGIIATYPRSRSALLPLLHLVQAEDGYLTSAGHRVLRGPTRPDRGRGHRGRHVLLDVPAHPDRRVPGRACARTRCARSWAATRFSTRCRTTWASTRARPPDGRPRHPRTHRVQRGVRLRTRRDGQLGVLRQPDPLLGTGSRRLAARWRAALADAEARRCALSGRPPESLRACPTTGPSPRTVRRDGHAGRAAGRPRARHGGPCARRRARIVAAEVRRHEGRGRRGHQERTGTGPVGNRARRTGDPETDPSKTDSRD